MGKFPSWPERAAEADEQIVFKRDGKKGNRLAQRLLYLRERDRYEFWRETCVIPSAVYDERCSFHGPLIKKAGPMAEGEPSGKRIEEGWADKIWSFQQSDETVNIDNRHWYICLSLLSLCFLDFSSIIFHLDFSSFFQAVWSTAARWHSVPLIFKSRSSRRHT